MNFQKLVQEVGLQIAVKIFLSRGSIDFLLSFKIEEKNDWEAQKLREALASVIKDSTLEELFLIQLDKNQQYFSFEWWRLLCCYEIPIKTRSYAIKKMERMASSFDDWKAICFATHEQAIRELAIEKMRTLAISCQDWHWLMNKFLPVSEKDFLISKMKESAVSFYDFDTLREIVPKNSADYTHAIAGMKGEAKSFDNWRHLLIYAEDANHQFIVEKMSNTAYSLFDLHSVWENSSEYPAIQTSALERMSGGIFSFHDWRNLFDSECRNFKSPLIKELAIEKMKEKSSSPGEWKLLYELAKEYPVIQKYAFEMLVKLSR